MSKLEHALHSKGYEVVATRAPGGTPLGKEIRNLLLNPDLGLEIGSRAELMLYLADRAQLIEEVIKPALKEGKVILCDRFNDSSAAYQGAARGLGIEEVQHLCDEVCEGLNPNITIFLDIDPKVGFSDSQKNTIDLRRKKSNSTNKCAMHSIPFQKKNPNDYISLMQHKHRKKYLPKP